jgi:hypothetical protein
MHVPFVHDIAICSHACPHPGVHVTLVLELVHLGLPVAALFDDPAAAAMIDATCGIIGLDNDVFSYPRERGESAAPLNAVAVLLRDGDGSGAVHLAASGAGSGAGGGVAELCASLGMSAEEASAMAAVVKQVRGLADPLRFECCGWHAC